MQASFNPFPPSLGYKQTRYYRVFDILQSLPVTSKPGQMASDFAALLKGIFPELTIYSSEPFLQAILPLENDQTAYFTLLPTPKWHLRIWTYGPFKGLTPQTINDVVNRTAHYASQVGFMLLPVFVSPHKDDVLIKFTDVDEELEKSQMERTLVCPETCLPVNPERLFVEAGLLVVNPEANSNKSIFDLEFGPQYEGRLFIDVIKNGEVVDQVLFAQLSGMLLKMRIDTSTLNVSVINNEILRNTFLNDVRQKTSGLTGSSEPLGDQGKHYLLQLNQKVSTFRNEFNDGSKAFMLPMLHGTQLEDAKKIAESGFGIVVKEDQGYFGQGIYFTSDYEYAQRYGNVVVVSLVTPGNAYPVTEDPIDGFGKRSPFYGAACRTGYDSHYALVGPKNSLKAYPIQTRFNPTKHADELAVFKEAQAYPFLILEPCQLFPAPPRVVIKEERACPDENRRAVDPSRAFEEDHSMLEPHPCQQRTTKNVPVEKCSSLLPDFKIQMMDMGIANRVKTKGSKATEVKVDQKVFILSYCKKLQALCDPNKPRDDPIYMTAYQEVSRQFSKDICIEGKNVVVVCSLCPEGTNILGSHVKKDILDHFNSSHLKHPIIEYYGREFYTQKNYRRYMRTRHKNGGEGESPKATEIDNEEDDDTTETQDQSTASKTGIRRKAPFEVPDSSKYPKVEQGVLCPSSSNLVSAPAPAPAQLVFNNCTFVSYSPQSEEQKFPLKKSSKNRNGKQKPPQQQAKAQPKAPLQPQSQSPLPATSQPQPQISFQYQPQKQFSLPLKPSNPQSASSFLSQHVTHLESQLNLLKENSTESEVYRCHDELRGAKEFSEQTHQQSSLTEEENTHLQQMDNLILEISELLTLKEIARNSELPDKISLGGHSYNSFYPPYQKPQACKLFESGPFNPFLHNSSYPPYQNRSTIQVNIQHAVVFDLKSSDDVPFMMGASPSTQGEIASTLFCEVTHGDSTEVTHFNETPPTSYEMFANSTEAMPAALPPMDLLNEVSLAAADDDPEHDFSPQLSPNHLLYQSENDDQEYDFSPQFYQSENDLLYPGDDLHAIDI